MTTNKRTWVKVLMGPIFVGVGLLVFMVIINNWREISPVVGVILVIIAKVIGAILNGISWVGLDGWLLIFILGGVYLVNEKLMYIINILQSIAHKEGE